MNYDDIKKIVYGYADREDAATVDMFDSFLRIVESKINRAFKVSEQSVRTQVPMVTSQEYYGLPADFNGLRDIEVIIGTASQTLKFVNPEQMNVFKLSSSPEGKVYSLVADQIQIWPTQSPPAVLELVYYKKIPTLTQGTNNWVAIDYPDLYVFGVLTEINAFLKDPQASALWDARYKEVLAEVGINDSASRWSGTSLTIGLG